MDAMPPQEKINAPHPGAEMGARIDLLHHYAKLINDDVIGFRHALINPNVTDQDRKILARGIELRVSELQKIHEELDSILKNVRTEIKLN
jgi:hypothetical protein